MTYCLKGSKSCSVGIKFSKLKSNQNGTNAKNSITLQVTWAWTCLMDHQNGHREGWSSLSLYLPLSLLPSSAASIPSSTARCSCRGWGPTHFDPLNAGPGHSNAHSDIMRLGVYFTLAAGSQLLCLAERPVYLHQIPALRLSINFESSDVPGKYVNYFLTSKN